MEGENNNSSNVTVPEMGATAAGAEEPPVLPSSEAEAAGVGLQEKTNYGDGGDDEQAVVVGGSGGQEQSGEKRKRGRPKKLLMPESLAPAEKRGRGRPKGSGKWQIWNSLADSSGSHFTPHSITIQRGEDIVQRICSFSQRPSEALCVISAVGVLSSAELYRPGCYTTVVKYEGRFDIVMLSGSHAINGINGRVCLLTVQLAKPDGALFGGAVAGPLIVREPAQVIFATFKLKIRAPLKTRHSVEPSRPNNVAVPTQMENGSVFGSVDNRTLLTIALDSTPAPPVDIAVVNDANQHVNLVPSNSTPAPPVDTAVVNDANQHVNHVSSEPFDWNSLGTSSQHMSTMSDIITGVITN